jgi:hypothetical protein
MKIARMLNQLYTAFDVLTDPKKNPNVYKVGSADNASWFTLRRFSNFND